MPGKINQPANYLGTELKEVLKLCNLYYLAIDCQ